MKEREIKVSLTPHSWDNPDAPYFWVILECHNNSWFNVCCGWEISVEKAWEVALSKSKELEGDK